MERGLSHPGRPRRGAGQFSGRPLPLLGPPAAFLGKVGTTPSAACWWTPWPGRAWKPGHPGGSDCVHHPGLPHPSWTESAPSASPASRGADTVLRFDELELSLIDQSRAFHFGALSLDGRASPLRHAGGGLRQGAGKLVTFDPNYRPPAGGARLPGQSNAWGLSRPTWSILSDEELSFLWGCTPEEGPAACGRSVVWPGYDHTGVPGLFTWKRQGACWAPAPGGAAGGHHRRGGYLRGSAVAKLLALDTPPAELEPGALEGIAASPSPPPACPPSAPAVLLHPHRGGGATPEMIEGPPGTGGPSIILQAVENLPPKEGLGNDTSHGGRGDKFAGNRAPSAIQSFSAGCITLWRVLRRAMARARAALSGNTRGCLLLTQTFLGPLLGGLGPLAVDLLRVLGKAHQQDHIVRLDLTKPAPTAGLPFAVHLVAQLPAHGSDRRLVAGVHSHLAVHGGKT